MHLPSDAYDELRKAQWVRVLDVVLIGPVMIWGGFVARGTGGAVATALGLLLLAFGLLTIAFNGRNWLRIAELGDVP